MLQPSAREVCCYLLRGRVLETDSSILVQYSIPNATSSIAGNELGIFESLDVHYSRKDLDIYYSTLYP